MQTLSRQGSVFGDVDIDTTLTIDLPDLEQLLRNPAPQTPSAPAPGTQPAPGTPPPPPAEYTTPPVLE